MTLAVIGVLGMGAIKFYKHTVNKVKAQNTAKMIKTIAFERQNMALRQESNLETTVKGPHSALHVKNGTSGNHQSYFWVETTLSDKDFCDSLKDSGFIQAEFVEVDGVADGNCRDNSKLAFYFKKNPNAQVYCPSHSTNCDTYGDATGCEEGYYLAGGVCESCGKHVVTCEDENTPFTCVDGYALYGSICSDLPSCTFDLDCDVCGECFQEGYCISMCSIPEPDQNDSCGNNECFVYDKNTQSCKYMCERKGYLESTRMQYIDVDFIPNQDTRISTDISYTKDPVNRGFIFGSGISATNTAFECYTWGGSWNSPYANTNIGVSHGSTELITSGIIHIDKNKNIFTAHYPDGTIRTGNAEYSTFTAPRNLWLFVINRGSSSADIRGDCIRIYNCKICDDGSLVRDFIPVKSPKGNCMFDRVSQKLFCNENSEGEDFKTD